MSRYEMWEKESGKKNSNRRRNRKNIEKYSS